MVYLLIVGYYVDIIQAVKSCMMFHYCYHGVVTGHTGGIVSDDHVAT